MREHTRVKLELLEKYLTGWVKILGRWHPRVLYFDGFAGRGQYEEGASKIIDGSPVRAMHVGQSFKDYIGEFVAVFVESNMDNYVNLRKVVEAEKVKCPNVKTMVVHGEFAKEIGELLDDLDEKGVLMAPSFFFVDPFGFGGVPFTLIKRILSKPKTEVLFTFMSRDINRFLNSPSHESTLTGLYGTDEWSKLVNLPEETRQEALVDLYRTQLLKNAGVQYVWPFKVAHTERRGTVYHLLHASNHFKALMLMKGIMYNQGAAGSFSYFGPDEAQFGKEQARLNLSEASSLKKILRDRFRGRDVSFDDLMKETWETPFIESDYRRAIRGLQADALVKVKPVSSKTERGLKGNDLLSF